LPQSILKQIYHLINTWVTLHRNCNVVLKINVNNTDISESLNLFIGFENVDEMRIDSNFLRHRPVKFL